MDRPTVEFDYCSSHHCHHTDSLKLMRESFANTKNGADKSYFNLLLNYTKKILGVYDKALASRLKAIEKGFETLGESPSMQQMVDNILYNLLIGWDSEFKDPANKVIAQNVDYIYKFFRKDKSIFGSKKSIPKSTFDLLDQRVIDFFKNSDSHYLGKFITDDDTIKRISTFIQDEYIGNNLPIGSNKDKNTLKSFREKFGDVLLGEDWKINRVIVTTVSKLRNYGAINYMTEAEIDTYEIVGINDRLQCSYCKEMQGRRFSVTKTRERIKEVVNSDIRHIGVISPFITSKFKNSSDIKSLTDEDLQNANIDLPPYHPHCRDRTVAIFSEQVPSNSPIEDVKSGADVDRLEIPQEFQDHGLTSEILDKLNNNEFKDIVQFRKYYDDLGVDYYQDKYSFAYAIQEWLGYSDKIRTLPDEHIQKRLFLWAVENNRTIDREIVRGIRLRNINNIDQFTDLYNSLKYEKTIQFGLDSTLGNASGLDLRLLSGSNKERIADEFSRWNNKNEYSLKMLVKNDLGVRGVRIGNLYNKGITTDVDYSEYETIFGDSFKYDILDVSIDEDSKNMKLIIKQIE